MDVIRGDGSLLKEIDLAPANEHQAVILVGYLYDQIEQFEPRAVVSDITFDHDAGTGRTVPIIYLEEVRTDNE